MIIKLNLTWRYLPVDRGTEKWERRDTIENNKCLISHRLSGSFLSSIGAQTDKISIYTSFQRFIFQLLNCQLFDQWNFIDFFRQPIKKWEKLLTMFALFWIKFTYLCLQQVYRIFSLIYSQHLTILGYC